eukprot:COSAG01_NODE_273_length_19739_cov_90.981925_4_plen_158_part_00
MRITTIVPPLPPPSSPPVDVVAGGGGVGGGAHGLSWHQSWHTTPCLLDCFPWHGLQSTWGPALPPTRPLPAGQTRQELGPAVGLYWLLMHGTQATVPFAPLEPGCIPAAQFLGGAGGVGADGHLLTAAFMTARANSPAPVSQETRLLSTYMRSRALR